MYKLKLINVNQMSIISILQLSTKFKYIQLTDSPITAIIMNQDEL